MKKAQKVQHFLKKVGRRIGEIRSENGYTQSRLAEKIGVSIQMVQYWESGRNVTLKTLYNLSQYYGHDVDVFLEDPLHLTTHRGRPRLNSNGNDHKKKKKLLLK